MAMNEINRSIKGLLGAVGLLEYCRGFQYCDLVRFLRKGFSICFHFSNLRFIGLHSALSDSVCDFSQNEKWCGFPVATSPSSRVAARTYNGTVIK